MAGLVAILLVGIFILVNYYQEYLDAHQTIDRMVVAERENLPATLTGKGKRLAFHDFEYGRADDTALHLGSTGHGGKQSMRLSRKFPFSPGLWTKFKDLRPGDSSWIRVTGYVWLQGLASEAKCSLVATCNHQGINYKYMFAAIEKEPVKTNQWNRISLDYKIPRPPDEEDVIQVYFWFRGAGEMLVDDIEIEFFAAK